MEAKLLREIQNRLLSLKEGMEGDSKPARQLYAFHDWRLTFTFMGSLETLLCKWTNWTALCSALHNVPDEILERKPRLCRPVLQVNRQKYRTLPISSLHRHPTFPVESVLAVISRASGALTYQDIANFVKRGLGMDGKPPLSRTVSEG